MSIFEVFGLAVMLFGLWFFYAGLEISIRTGGKGGLLTAQGLRRMTAPTLLFVPVWHALLEGVQLLGALLLTLALCVVGGLVIYRVALWVLEPWR